MKISQIHSLSSFGERQSNEIKISTRLRPPSTKTKRHTARALPSERCDTDSEAECSSPKKKGRAPEAEARRPSK